MRIWGGNSAVYHDTSEPKNFGIGIPQSLKPNTEVIPQVRRFILPSVFFPINFLVINLSLRHDTSSWDNAVGIATVYRLEGWSEFESWYR
jgi:hypothetical protein